MQKIIIIFIFLFISACSNFNSDIKNTLETRAPAATKLELREKCREDFQCKSNNCNSGYCDRGQIISCRPIGLFCNSGHDCCSDSCIQGLCIGSSKQCAKVEQYCSTDSQCCSEYCSRETGRCQGSAKECAFVAQRCGNDSECCSGYCSRELNVCLGSQSDLAQFDEICRSDSQCSSNYCSREQGRCGN